MQWCISEERHRDHTLLPLTPMGAEGVPGLARTGSRRPITCSRTSATARWPIPEAWRSAPVVAADVNITFKILYNQAVAMTGGQPVTGATEVPALTRELEAMGTKRIIVVAEDPSHYGEGARWAPDVEVWSRDRLPDAERALADVKGVTALIYDERCAAEERRLRRRGELPAATTRVVINESVCEGCGDCQVKSNCLSVVPVDTRLGRKTQIHQASCNQDLTCVDGDCPSFVTIDVTTVQKSATPAAAARLTCRCPRRARIRTRWTPIWSGSAARAW